MAARLAPRIGLTLPAYVERALAGVAATDNEPAQRTPDAALVIAFAALVVNVVKLNWDVYQASKPKPDALNATELLLLRQLLAERIEKSAQLPAQAPGEARALLVEAVIDETIAEARQLPPKPPGA